MLFRSLEKYLGFMRREWLEIPVEQLEEACAHVAAHDFPETESGLRAMAGRAGFTRIERLVRHGPHHGWVFSRSA